MGKERHFRDSSRSREQPLTPSREAGQTSCGLSLLQVVPSWPWVAVDACVAGLSHGVVAGAGPSSRDRFIHVYSLRYAQITCSDAIFDPLQVSTRHTGVRTDAMAPWWPSNLMKDEVDLFLLDMASKGLDSLQVAARRGFGRA